jgi:predicted deacylase
MGWGNGMIPEIVAIPLMQLASGDRLSLQVYKFIGATPGKKAYLQANLHGAEIAGNAVLYKLIEWLSRLNTNQLTGEVWLVPVCNPLGTSQRSHYFSCGRYNPYDGKDWNRIFWDYETVAEDMAAFAKAHLNSDRALIQQQFRQQIRQSFEALSSQMNAPSSVPTSEFYRYSLQSLCLDADYLIDLHTSAGSGVDYVYYFRDRSASAALFGLPIGILLDIYDGDAFDEAFIKPWLALEQQFAALGRRIQFDVEAWTLELGSAMQMNPRSVKRGILGVKNYLAHKKMIPREEPLPSNSIYFATRSGMKRYYAPVGGMVQACLEPGSLVTKGQQLYQILSFNREGRSPQVLNICAEQDGLVFDVTLNQAVNQGEYVLGIL